MRGARVYPTDVEVRGFSSSPASRSRAFRPGRRVRRSSASPRRTMVRFSPVRLITSATVPMAARSAYFRSSSSRRSGPPRASTSLRATPTPARHLKG